MIMNGTSISSICTSEMNFRNISNINSCRSLYRTCELFEPISILNSSVFNDMKSFNHKIRSMIKNLKNHTNRHNLKRWR
jgi:hypothetical protein